MKFLRISFAALSLVAMTALFTVPGAATCAYLGWLPKAQLVPAIMALEFVTLAVIAVSVALFGRLYCSVVCPLGIVQDLVRFLAVKLHIARSASPRGPVNFGRYAVLALFIIGAFFGMAAIFEPYGIFGRFLTAGVMRIGEPGVLVIVWAIALFALIMLMTVFRARVWCNTICPVGTFLGLFSRFSVFRVRIDREKCVGCGLCVKKCDKGAIVKTEKGVEVDSSRCVMCLDCIGRHGACASGLLHL